MNSPDVRLGPGVVPMKKSSKFGEKSNPSTNSTQGTDESDDVDEISDDKSGINMNIKNYQNGGMNNSILAKTREGMMGTINPLGMMSSPSMQKKVLPEKTQKKVLGVQNNLLNFLKKNQPENPSTMSANQADKANQVRNVLKNMEI